MSHNQLSTAPAASCSWRPPAPGTVDNLRPQGSTYLSWTSVQSNGATSLYALMRPGRFTLNGRSVDPPKTLIAHAAMFTGLPPELNGKRDNDWLPGDFEIEHSTLFDDAKKLGYRTAFFYSKQKLGYLVNPAVDLHALEPINGVRRSSEFFASAEKSFVFLHVSGLEYAGTDAGWLSAEYKAELTDIDKSLVQILAQMQRYRSFATIVTSDHGGHDRTHGTSHPDDFRLPLIIDATDVAVIPLTDAGWSITKLRSLVRSFLK